MPKQVKIINQLLRRPKREKGDAMPKFQVFLPNFIQQADVLYMPNDRGYKYIICVIDDASKKIDAQEMKTHSAEEVASAFGKIYSRGILKIPKRIEVDSGSEFKGASLKWMKDNNIIRRVALTGRHRQQALVERANQTLQKLLFRKMLSVEVLTGEQNRDWVDNLRHAVKMMNSKVAEKPIEKPDPKALPLGKGELLTIGTKVRVQLEEPRNPITGNKLHGKFRTGDVRWDVRPRTIMAVQLRPNYPPFYMVNDLEHKGEILKVGYTRNQLQVIPRSETYPNAREVLKGKHVKTYRIDKIVGQKYMKGKLYLKIHWIGFSAKDDTWEPASELRKDKAYGEILEEFLKD